MDKKAGRHHEGGAMGGTWLRIAGGAGLAVATAALSYPTLLRRPCLTWGATPEEAARELPGDDLLADPDIISTRAITIGTYDWIENLFGLGMHSADEILPQFQDLKLGDEFPLGPGRPTMRVEVFEPERALTFRFEDQNWVWTFALFPAEGRTRLLSRNRIAAPHASALTRLFNLLVMEPGSLVMERRMLLGIKERAQRLAGGLGQADPAAPART
jgi:hypothetical protein